MATGELRKLVLLGNVPYSVFSTWQSILESETMLARKGEQVDFTPECGHNEIILWSCPDYLLIPVSSARYQGEAGATV